MPISISYMGTKKGIATAVADLSAESQKGIFLDLFSGMCAVGQKLSECRQVWTNDMQEFAALVAYTHFCSDGVPPKRDDIAFRIKGKLSKLRSKKYETVKHNLISEMIALRSEEIDPIQNLYSEWRSNDLKSGGEPYKIFERNFSGSYFSLAQAIEIDSIRQILDEELLDGQISKDDHNWTILALAVALSKCAAVTGHFAQSLTPKKNSFQRYTAQRQKDIFENWVKALESFKPIRDSHWRKGNISYKGDALETLDLIKHSEQAKPAVVYADPPYTSDQYSRFYHVYETLVLYDYPAAIGRGRYRENRTVSKFSLKSEVSMSMQQLIDKCADLDSDLILSYPTNGLLKKSREIIPEMIKKSYGCNAQVVEIPYKHSTMGGSKGAGKNFVTEVVYRAKAA